MWAEIKRITENIDGGESTAVYVENECNGAISKHVHLLIEDEGDTVAVPLAENECIALRDKLNKWFPTNHKCKCGGKCHADTRG